MGKDIVSSNFGNITTYARSVMLIVRSDEEERKNADELGFSISTFGVSLSLSP